MSKHEYVSIKQNMDWKKAKVIAAGVDIGAMNSKAMILLDGQPLCILPC